LRKRQLAGLPIPVQTIACVLAAEKNTYRRRGRNTKAAVFLLEVTNIAPGVKPSLFVPLVLLHSHNTGCH
jgi:hypothetical protein